MSSEMWAVAILALMLIGVGLANRLERWGVRRRAARDFAAAHIDSVLHGETYWRKDGDRLRHVPRDRVVPTPPGVPWHPWTPTRPSERAPDITDDDLPAFIQARIR